MERSPRYPVPRRGIERNHNALFVLRHSVQVESLGIEDRRLGVGHRQHHRESASQRGRRAGVPIFFVGLSGFAEMNVRVNQARKFDHDGLVHRTMFNGMCLSLMIYPLSGLVQAVRCDAPSIKKESR